MELKQKTSSRSKKEMIDQISDYLLHSDFEEIVELISSQIKVFDELL